MGYLLLAKPITSANWTYGKWFSSHSEAQSWVNTIPVGSIVYRIIEIKEEMLTDKTDTKCQITEDEDIPSEVIVPQCSLNDEECESCQ